MYQNITLKPTLGHFGYPGGASRGQKVIWLRHDFFWAEIFCFFCKTPYIYPRYQVWGVMDLGFDFWIFHWIATQTQFLEAECSGYNMC